MNFGEERDHSPASDAAEGLVEVLAVSHSEENAESDECRKQEESK